VVRSAVTSPIVAFFLSVPSSLSLVGFLLSRSTDDRSVGVSPLTSIDCCIVLMATMALSALASHSKIHSCGDAGNTGLSVRLFSSFGSLHFVALICTSSIFFKLHSVNAFFFFRCQWHSCSLVVSIRCVDPLLHFIAGSLVAPADVPQLRISSLFVVADGHFDTVRFMVVDGPYDAVNSRIRFLFLWWLHSTSTLVDS
jgi:hypothetical protein